MNNIETILVNDNNKEITLYVLLEINNNNKKYIFYTKELKKYFSKDDIYVGEITEKNQLIPLNNKLIPSFENIFENIMKNLQNK